jgi:hypothetical protein
VNFHDDFILLLSFSVSLALRPVAMINYIRAQKIIIIFRSIHLPFTMCFCCAPAVFTQTRKKMKIPEGY